MGEQTDALMRSTRSIDAMLTRSKAQPASLLDICPVQILERKNMRHFPRHGVVCLLIYSFIFLRFFFVFVFLNSISIRPRQHQRIVKCSSCYIHSTVTHPANAHDGFSCVSASACSTGKLRYSRDTFVYMYMTWYSLTVWYGCGISSPALSARCYEQETQLSLTNRATHLCKCNGVADLQKTRTSPYVLPRRIWSFCFKSCGGQKAKNTAEPQNFVALKLQSLGWEIWLTLQAPPHMCYHVKFGSSAIKGYE